MIGRKLTNHGVTQNDRWKKKSISDLVMDSNSTWNSPDDEFEQQLKRQRLEGKENIAPNRSPLLSKLTEISFNSSDFENDTSQQHFRKLLGDVGDLLQNPPKTIQPKAKRKKAKPDKKQAEPYSRCRVDRPGMTMFDVVEATNTPDKVVTFLQQRGCLPTTRLCPDCGNEMNLTNRMDAIQSKVFRCRRRHGHTCCQKNISITSGTFFFMYTCRCSLCFGYSGGFAKVFTTRGLSDI